MGRIILGVIVAFIAWMIFLIGSDYVWAVISLDYVNHQKNLIVAMNNKIPFMADSIILIIAVIRSAILSIIAGFIAALIAGENFKSPLLLGILLFIFGIFIHSMILNNVPLWYHFLILLPLIPMTLLGGKLRKLYYLQKLLI